MRPSIISALAILTLAPLAACGKSDPASPPAPPIDVRIATVGSSVDAARITAAGVVALRRESTLAFTSAGRILRITVNEGDRVRTGQMLAALDPTSTASALATAEAERVRATAEYRRSAELFEKGWVPRPRVESAEAAMRVAEANVRAARFQTSNARILAPGPGIILARLTEPGQVVAAGTPVLSLGEAASGYVLKLAVPDRDAATLRIGAPATVAIDALGDQRISGRIQEIAGRADPATGTFLVEVALPGDPRLRSGQVGTASILSTAPVSQRLAVPPQAVFAARAGDGFVYVVDLATNRVKARRVALGETSDASIVVTGGLSRGEVIALSGIDRLVDGQRIRPVSAARAADPAARPAR